MADIKDMIDSAYTSEKEGDYEEAIKLFESIIDYFRNSTEIHKVKYFEAKKLECEAKLLKERGKFKEAADKVLSASNVWNALNKDKYHKWCLANYYSWMGEHYIKQRKFEKAIDYYSKAKLYFNGLGSPDNIKYCEIKILYNKAIIEKKNNRYLEAANLFFEVSKLWRELENYKSSLRSEMEAWGTLGQNELRNENYDMAKFFFKVAEKLSSALELEKAENWYTAKYYECEYRLLKETGDLDSRINILEKIAKHLEKTNDKIGLFATLGDLYKFKGLKLKLEEKVDEAINFFIESKKNYEMAATKDARHKISAKYVEALILETEANKLIKESKYGEAAEKFRLACEIFKHIDKQSAEVCNRYAEFFRLISEGNLEEATKIVTEHFPTTYNRPLQSVVALVSYIAPSIKKRTQELINEAIHSDKGPSFEARVRELIRKFNGMQVDGMSCSIFPPDRITLYKYDKVENKVIKPTEDEVGIVYEDKTPVEIDVFGVRDELERQKIFIAECKDRPMNKITIKDIELLLKKVELVLKRYSKIAELEEKNKPKIDYVWFIVGSYDDFPEKIKEYAKANGVYLLNLTSLNNLCKLFGLPRWK